jgi:hypothetical protein
VVDVVTSVGAVVGASADVAVVAVAAVVGEAAGGPSPSPSLQPATRPVTARMATAASEVRDRRMSSLRGRRERSGDRAAGWPQAGA